MVTAKPLPFFKSTIWCGKCEYSIPGKYSYATSVWCEWTWKIPMPTVWQDLQVCL